jgi:hypothetical protein
VKIGDNPDFSSFRGQIWEFVISPFSRQVEEKAISRHLREKYRNYDIFPSKGSIGIQYHALNI